MTSSRARTTHRSRIVVLLMTLTSALAFGSVVDAHDEIAGSDPVDRSVLDEPISQVTIDFDNPVGNVEMALVDPDDLDLPGTVTKLTDSTARLDFDTLDQEGQYIVRYLAEEDGHLIAGAISFVYGSTGSTGAGLTTWLIVGAAAILILAAGAYFSFRPSRRDESTDAVVAD